MGNELKPDLHALVRDALDSCIAGGYRDIDGDWCERRWFDEDKVKAAKAALSPSASDPVGEPVAWMRHDGMKAMPADEKAAYEAQSDNLSKSIAAEYSIPLYASPPPLLAKCAQIAEWHLQDNDECGVLAREVYEAITKASASPLPQEPREAEQVCAEAYQVVGSLLSDLGRFDTPEAEKILDNLSQAKMVHKDVLPWPSYEPREAEGMTPERILHLWDTHVGEPTAKLPLSTSDKLAFARAIERELRGAQEGKAE
jgi:hypothetical protein